MVPQKQGGVGPVVFPLVNTSNNRGSSVRVVGKLTSAFLTNNYVCLQDGSKIQTIVAVAVATLLLAAQ